MSTAIILIMGMSSMCSSVCGAGFFYTCTDGTLDTGEFSSNNCLSFLTTKCEKIDEQDKCDKKKKCKWDGAACTYIDGSGPSSSGSSGGSPPSEYKYDFIINVKSAHTDDNDTFGMHITDIRIDGVRATDDQIDVIVEPGHAKCNSKTDGDVKGYECEDGVYGMNDNEPADPEFLDLTWSGWKEEQLSVGTKFMTITTTEKVSKFEIDYFRPKYVPGLIIKENGEEVVKEDANGGSEDEPNPKTVTYNI